MKKYFTFLFLIITTHLFCQKQANTWYFGNDGAGLDFTTGCNPLVLTDGKINGFEGCAAISDKSTGQFLFSTNSEWIWNRNQDTIPNSHLVTGGSTITQVMIIQKPTFDSLYYIITAEIQGGLGGFPIVGYQFHLIDMTMNGGLGGIVFKDSLLYLPPVTEKITAIQHANGIDIWLIGHQYNTNKYLSFLVTSSGIHTTPIISQIGKVQGDVSTGDAIGELKPSPNGLKLAAVTLEDPNIELFDFDNSTGQISNLITLPEKGAYDTATGGASGLYGLSFSPNNSMLYVSEWFSDFAGVQGKIIQYNVSSNDSAIINSSRVNIDASSQESFYSLKLAPNGKIYVSHEYHYAVSGYLGVINFPDSSGLNCNYNDSGVYLNGKHGAWGLNNIMEYGNYCYPLGINENTNKILKIEINPNPNNGLFIVELNSVTKQTMQVYDVNGKTVLTQTINGKTTIDASSLNDGIYNVSLQSNEGMVNKRLVIVK